MSQVTEVLTLRIIPAVAARRSQPRGVSLFLKCVGCVQLFEEDVDLDIIDAGKVRLGGAGEGAEDNVFRRDGVDAGEGSGFFVVLFGVHVESFRLCFRRKVIDGDRGTSLVHVLFYKVCKTHLALNLVDPTFL